MPTVTSQKIVAQIGGLRGASAYDLWLAEGNTGTLDEYLAEQAALTFTRGLFPGPRDALFPEEAAGFARVKAIRLYGADPSKVPILRYLFWKDTGTRFRMEIMLADNPSGTNAVSVCELFVPSGADVWTGWREITLAEVSGSGVTGTAIVDFTNPAAIEINLAPVTATQFQRRQISAQILISSAARDADISAIVAGFGLDTRNLVPQLSVFLIGGNDAITGVHNTGAGYHTLESLTTGTNNSAIGYNALNNLTAGGFCTAIGASALASFTGDGATALGESAGFSAITAGNLVALGRRAAYFKTTGADCTYVGFSAGFGFGGSVPTGDGNAAFGAFALGHETTGSFNTAIGRASLWYNTTGNNNAFCGYRAGYGNSIGGANAGLGFYAGHNNQTGSNNTYLGTEADILFPAISGATATPVAGTGLAIGAYAYRITFVIDGVETAPSEPLNATTTAGNQQVNLAGLPVYVGPRTCTARRIYRTPVNGEHLYFLTGTIPDNSTTTFSDTTPDGSLGAQPTGVSNTITVGRNARARKAGQAVFGSTTVRLTEVYFGGGEDDTAPTAVTISSSNASGTNAAGADLRLRGGASTGAGNGGRVILAAAKPGSSGTAGNATADIMTIDGRGFLNLSETTAADVPTPAPGSVNIFLEGGDLKFRRPDGTVRTINAV